MLAIVAITKEGRNLARKLGLGLREKNRIFTPSAKGAVKKLAPDIFDKDKFDGIVFIMALGIVVRLIAPYIKDKYSDPAVVVVDEAGHFAISALSGHEGGANELAVKVANVIGAEPIITTASESRKNIVIGIGCRRGVKKEEVIKAIKYALKKTSSSLKNVRYFATIDLKKDEGGLKEAALECGAPLRIISTDTIKNFNGDYKRSNFVKEKIGVEGVCVPCALLASRNPKLILPKIKLGPVTVAVARDA